ncbi:MAG: type IV toxin-antitoxin system AbiEi family antitoxin domain-containing protein [Lachnospiraceae bacterium]|nr:type IV toxin-antitoxin system AbiEi family antitoxin domain-containing protein [Lachnospiraceae bacterium]
MRRSTYDKLETVYRKFKGYIGTPELLKEGFSNRQIAVMAEEGHLEKVCHGYYWLAGKKEDKPSDYKCIEVCLSDPRAIICMNSALYYQGEIKEEPEYLDVATARTDRSLLSMDFPITRHYFSTNNYLIGAKKKETEFGCYNIYDIERSICDVLRLESYIDIETVDKIKAKEEQYRRILKYAELLRIKKQL